MKSINYYLIAVVGVILITFIVMMFSRSKPEIQYVPRNAIFVVTDTSSTKPLAYKIDTLQPWIIFDSTATLRALLLQVENEYKQAVYRQKMLSDTTKKHAK